MKYCMGMKMDLSNTNSKILLFFPPQVIYYNCEQFEYFLTEIFQSPKGGRKYDCPFSLLPMFAEILNSGSVEDLSFKSNQHCSQ